MSLILVYYNIRSISPLGDILIHAGDFSNYGLVSEIVAFNDWLATLPHKVNMNRNTPTEPDYFLSQYFQHKIVVAGNHELSFDPGTLEESRYYMRQVGEEGDTTKVVTNIIMLKIETQLSCAGHCKPPQHLILMM